MKIYSKILVILLLLVLVLPFPLQCIAISEPVDVIEEDTKNIEEENNNPTENEEPKEDIDNTETSKNDEEIKENVNNVDEVEDNAEKTDEVKENETLDNKETQDSSIPYEAMPNNIDANEDETDEMLEYLEDDPMQYRELLKNQNTRTFSTFSTRSGPYGPIESVNSIIKKYSDATTVVGIDVSYYQENIDWRQVAQSGVKFAMIRCGFRGYGSEGKLKEDPRFREYIKGAKENGISVGVYFYSTALNESEALAEAKFVVNLIKGYSIDYPVAYDYEEFQYLEGHRTNKLVGNNAQINRNAKKFLSYIKSCGYKASLYGSTNYLNNIWDMNSISASYDTWVAQWGVSKPTYSKNYQMWQYTDGGTVPGISGYVDIDIDYQYRIDIASYLFDATYYADKYPDLKKAYGYNKSKLKSHYLNYGKKEGRSASPCFDPKYYLNKYSDLKKAYKYNYIAAYNHFVKYGLREGRQGSKYFSVTYYYNNNDGLKYTYGKNYPKLFWHFVVAGLSEGRLASSEFNVKAYKGKLSTYYQTRLGNDYKKYMVLDGGTNPCPNNKIDVTNYLFDATYYADKYPDLKKGYGYNTSKLKNHYLKYGIKEGRSASPCFDPKYYLNKYPDLKKAYKNNYVAAYNHFRKYGIHEGRQGSKYFSAPFYANTYQDLRNNYERNYSKMLYHFALYGVNEGRQGSKEFYVKTYKTTLTPYYQIHLKNNYKKYIVLNSGTNPCPNNKIDVTNYLFDATYYADKNPDLKKAYGYNTSKLKNHYLKYGIKEGRSASPCFDPKYYLNKYSDLKKAYKNNYVAAYNHFRKYGIHEGRQGSKYFNAPFYANTYQDLRNNYERNYSKMLYHFALYGVNEGRQGSKEFYVKTYKTTLTPYYQTRLKNNYKKYIVLNAGGNPL